MYDMDPRDKQDPTLLDKLLVPLCFLIVVLGVLSYVVPLAMTVVQK